jgi:transcriptional regulator GlxA family with amidase domain
MIVPRSRCVVRHRAENYRPGELSEAIFDLVFDVGRLFGEDDGRDTREARLRQELRRNPKDALAAANLGFLLIQKDELAEAEKWLRQATRMELSLPDGGRRVRMELREIERRRHQVRSYIPGVIQRHLDEMHKGVDLQ